MISFPLFNSFFFPFPLRIRVEIDRIRAEIARICIEASPVNVSESNPNTRIHQQFFNFPVGLDDVSLINWRRDRFGNPIPLPSLPVASILTSLVSLLYLALTPVKIHRLRHSLLQILVQFSTVIYRCKILFF